MRKLFRFLILFSIFSSILIADAYAGLVWPTPNPAFQNGEPIEAFVQPTASGKKESGLFGCVRNNGRRFHEGLDLYPVERNKSGEPVDTIYAVLPGRIVHVNKVAGYSNYGRYIVIEHDQESPVFHTLYAHLAKIDDMISVGKRVESGTVIGIMGRSSSSPIPRSRAHLHFEIGFRLTNDFQGWYDRQKFKTKNRHRSWNGMNLVSVNPLDFYQDVRLGKVRTLYEHLQRVPTYARIRVHTTDIPDFVKRYPELVTRPYRESSVVAWDIAFSKYGVPKEWTPRFANENLTGSTGDVTVLSYNPELLKQQSCRRVINLSGNKPSISSGTLTTLEKLFGFR